MYDSRNGLLPFQRDAACEHNQANQVTEEIEKYNLNQIVICLQK